MDTAQKLCILHLLDINKDPLDMATISEILVGLRVFKPLEIDIIIGDLRKSNLIRVQDNKVSLEDEGLVILEFFRDRIDLNLQRKIKDAVEKNKPLGRWTSSYNEDNGRLLLSYLRNNENLLSMEFHLERPAYELIKDNLKDLDDNKFTEIKRFILNF